MTRASPTWRCRTWPGNLGASNDQSTWVLTSYLVSNAVVLPMSGWLATAFGRKRFFTICLFMFTASSPCCAGSRQAWDCCFFSRAARRGGWRSAADGTGHPGGYLPSPTARAGIRALRHHGCHRARRLARRWAAGLSVQLFLAMDFLHQSSRRPADIISRPTSLSKIRRIWQRASKAAGVKLDYIGIALLTLGVGALQITLDHGTGRRLVRIAIHYVIGSHRSHLSPHSGDLGVVSKSSHRRRPALQEFQFREFQPDDVHAGYHVVRQPGSDAAVSPDADGAARPRSRDWRFSWEDFVY